MIYRQKDFIKLISEESGYYQNAVKAILDAAANVFDKMLSESTVDEQVDIKVFPGLTIGTKYYKAKSAKDPRTNEDIEVPEHIYPYAEWTQAYKNKIRSVCDKQEE